MPSISLNPWLSPLTRTVQCTEIFWIVTSCSLTYGTNISEECSLCLQGQCEEDNMWLGEMIRVTWISEGAHRCGDPSDIRKEGRRYSHVWASSFPCKSLMCHQHHMLPCSFISSPITSVVLSERETCVQVWKDFMKCVTVDCSVLHVIPCQRPFTWWSPSFDSLLRELNHCALCMACCWGTWTNCMIMDKIFRMCWSVGTKGNKEWCRGTFSNFSCQWCRMGWIGHACGWWC